MADSVKPYNVTSVTEIKDKNEQIAEIDRRLQAKYDDWRKAGAALVPVAIMVALGIDDNTYDRWMNGKVCSRDETGKRIEISEDDAGLSKEEKETNERRRELIKKYLTLGKESVIYDTQAKPNNTNGGSLFVAQAVYKITAKDDKAEQVGLSLEDLITAAAGAINKTREQGNT